MSHKFLKLILISCASISSLAFSDCFDTLTKGNTANVQINKAESLTFDVLPGGARRITIHNNAGGFPVEAFISLTDGWTSNYSGLNTQVADCKGSAKEKSQCLSSVDQMKDLLAGWIAGGTQGAALNCAKTLISNFRDTAGSQGLLPFCPRPQNTGALKSPPNQGQR